MAASITGGGIQFPHWTGGAFSGQTTSFATHSLTTSSGFAMIGRLYINGGASEKLFSSAGGKLSFRSGAAGTWTALSIFAIGVQDVNLAAGPPIQTDLVYDVSTTITSSTVAYPLSTWNTWTMTNGSKSMSHGELYGVVVRMATRISTDFATIAGITGVGAVSSLPCNVSLSAGTAWSSSQSLPNVLFEFDDGTLGWFQGGRAVSSISTASIFAGAANNEFGLKFALPWTAQVDTLGVKAEFGPGVSAATFKACLYSDPKGTPTTVTAVTVDGHTFPFASTQTFFTLPLTNPATLTASTTYMLSVISDTLSACSIQLFKFADAQHKLTLGSGTSLGKGVRSGGAGAFSMVETTVPSGFFVRCNKVLDTTVTATTTLTITTTITIAGGGGVLVNPGMTGGIRG